MACVYCEKKTLVRWREHLDNFMQVLPGKFSGYRLKKHRGAVKLFTAGPRYANKAQLSPIVKKHHVTAAQDITSYAETIKQQLVLLLQKCI